MKLNLEVNGMLVMQAMNVTSHNGTSIWYDSKRLCCLSPEVNGITKISIRDLESDAKGRKSTEAMFGLPQDDYGMNLEDDVLTEEERQELEDESDEENAKR